MTPSVCQDTLGKGITRERPRHQVCQETLGKGSTREARWGAYAMRMGTTLDESMYWALV